MKPHRHEGCGCGIVIVFWLAVAAVIAWIVTH